MGLPEWLGPVTGALALGSAAALVGLYFYGLNVPAEHVVSRSAEIGSPPEAVWDLLADFPRRVEWRPHIVRVVDAGEVAGRPSWREFAEDGDRFQFVVDEASFADGQGRLILRTAKPQEMGMDATWIWTIEPSQAGTEVTVTERGRVDNPLFRAVWALREGPYAAIDLDLGAFEQAFEVK